MELEEQRKELKECMEEAVKLGRNLHERLRGENWDQTESFLSSIEDVLKLPDNRDFFDRLSEKDIAIGRKLLDEAIAELKQRAAQSLN